MVTIVRDRVPTTAQPDPPAPRREWSRERMALLVLLGGTAALYLVDLGASGWANPFYSAAVQAGSQSWKAFLFGASDAAGSITVDKPPLALWPMVLSVRIFGLSAWSILIPQALMGVASVALLTAFVRRATGNAWAGLLAGLVLALTPVAVLMFRYNNPDALLTLLLTGAAYAVLRSLEGSARALWWLTLAGALLGLAFLTKTLEVFVVLPAFALTYACFAAGTWRRRVAHLLAAFGAMAVAGGWWVALVELWPADSRPYIGGSQNNDFLELTFGYNGFGRLTGDETGSVSAGHGWGATGVVRMFGARNGGEVSWLLVAGLILGITALWLGARTVRIATSVMLGWLLGAAVTFSLMAGIYHAYYTVAIAPAIAGCVGLGGWLLWQHRRTARARVVGWTVLVVTVIWSVALLSRTPDWLPWLRWTILAVGAVVVVLAGFEIRSKVAGLSLAGLALAVVLAGPTAYAVDTAATPHGGAIPTSGPIPQRGAGPPLPAFSGLFGHSRAVGGLLWGSEPTPALTSLLRTDAQDYTWVAAIVGSNSAAGFQLATGSPVMAIGGFNGTDPSPTLAQFQADVAAHRIHYFIADGGGSHATSAGDLASQRVEITSWVRSHFSPTVVDGVTLYDLSGG
ncbi:glycosyltransferase family 39 protein [Nocardioides sp. GXZ039]|uniref:glycosyltransferase family 39 protein n=1 Tax=Nocardioides sp. GXZ039 TaxID=3136018 RepID=UPI0030F41F41